MDSLFANFVSLSVYVYAYTHTYFKLQRLFFKD
jgi:hypothetical protein